MYTEWFIAGGTLVLALVALFQDFIRSCLNTPKLEIWTKPATPYCKKLLFINKINPQILVDGYGLRIAVKNITPRFRVKARAFDVEIFAAKLEKKAQDGSYYPVQGFDPMNLIWSDSFMPFTSLSPGMERYCFVGRTLKPIDRHNFPLFDDQRLPSDKTCLKLDTVLARHTKEHIISPGTYRLECLIGSANTKAVSKSFDIYLSGDWYDDEVEMYEKGLSISMIN
jgi:hypothetical protein